MDRVFDRFVCFFFILFSFLFVLIVIPLLLFYTLKPFIHCLDIKGREFVCVCCFMRKTTQENCVAVHNQISILSILSKRHHSLHLILLLGAATTACFAEQTLDFRVSLQVPVGNGKWRNGEIDKWIKGQNEQDGKIRQS